MLPCMKEALCLRDDMLARGDIIWRRLALCDTRYDSDDGGDDDELRDKMARYYAKSIIVEDEGDDEAMRCCHSYAVICCYEAAGL